MKDKQQTPVFDDCKGHVAAPVRNPVPERQQAPPQPSQKK